MEKIIEINFYHYIDFENMHTVEMEIINHKDKMTTWKIYKAKTREKVVAIAKAQETRIMNKAMKAYKPETIPEKLTKETKQYIKSGDILKFNDREQYLITLVLEDKRGHITVTMQDLQTKQYIYLYPISKLYGSEIIRKEEN